MGILDTTRVDRCSRQPGTEGNGEEWHTDFLQGTGFLLLHRDTRELLAAASFTTMEQAKQVDINMWELKAVQMAIGLLVAVRAGKALELARIRTTEFTHPELRALKTKVCDG